MVMTNEGMAIIMMIAIQGAFLLGYRIGKSR